MFTKILNVCINSKEPHFNRERRIKKEDPIYRRKTLCIKSSKGNSHTIIIPRLKDTQTFTE